MEQERCPKCNDLVVKYDGKASSVIIVCKKCSLIQDLPLSPQCSACSCGQFERIGSQGYYYFCHACKKAVSPETVPSEVSTEDIRALGSVFTQPAQ